MGAWLADWLAVDSGLRVCGYARSCDGTDRKREWRRARERGKAGASRWSLTARGGLVELSDGSPGGGCGRFQGTTELAWLPGGTRGLGSEHDGAVHVWVETWCAARTVQDCSRRAKPAGCKCALLQQGSNEMPLGGLARVTPVTAVALQQTAVLSVLPDSLECPGPGHCTPTASGWERMERRWLVDS